jgi:uncharacterized protein (TIGR00369 family)
MGVVDMPDQGHFRKLERMYHGAPINQIFAPRLVVGEGRAEVSMAVKPKFFHAAQALHGSVYFKALDDAAFFAVNSLLEDCFALTVSFNVYLVRPVSQGTILATGRVVHRSRRLFVAEAVLLDSAGAEIGRGSGTFMTSSIALTPEIGYA